MSANREVLTAEERFFAALAAGDRDALEHVAGEDLVLVDVMSGSEVPGAVFAELIGSRRLIFVSIERLEARVRHYDAAAIVTGRTRMAGRFDGRSFQVHSRYTHVYTLDQDGWRLVAAQGTPVVEGGPEATAPAR
jgi:ketosteroid isomerase-like protein